MTVDIDLISAIASRVSGTFALVAILVAGYMRVIVWGYQLVDMRRDLDEARAECKEYKDIAKRSLEAAAGALQTTQKTLDVAKESK